MDGHSMFCSPHISLVSILLREDASTRSSGDLLQPGAGGRGFLGRDGERRKGKQESILKRGSGEIG